MKHESEQSTAGSVELSHAKHIDDGMSDGELLATYVGLERGAETSGESWADGFVRVQFKKCVLARMARGQDQAK